MHPWQNKNLLWFARRYTSGEVVRLIWIALSFKGIASRDSGGGGGGQNILPVHDQKVNFYHKNNGEAKKEAYYILLI